MFDATRGSRRSPLEGFGGLVVVGDVVRRPRLKRCGIAHEQRVKVFGMCHSMDKARRNLFEREA